MRRIVLINWPVNRPVPFIDPKVGNPILIGVADQVLLIGSWEGQQWKCELRPDGRWNVLTIITDQEVDDLVYDVTKVEEKPLQNVDEASKTP